MEGLFNERLQVRTRQLQQRVESLSKQLAAHKEHNARLQHEHEEASKKVSELEKHLEAERERCHKLSVSLSSCRRHSNNKYRERLQHSTTHHDCHLNRLMGAPPPLSDTLANNNNVHPSYNEATLQPPSICCCNRIHAVADDVIRNDFQPDCVGIMPARRPNPRLTRQKMNKRHNNPPPPPPPPDYLQPNRSVSPGARAANNTISCGCTGVVDHTDSSAALPSQAYACFNCSCPLHESVTEEALLQLHTLPQPNVDVNVDRSRSTHSYNSCRRNNGCGNYKGCAEITNPIQSEYSPMIAKCPSSCPCDAAQSRTWTTRMAATGGTFPIQSSSSVVVESRPHQQSQPSTRWAPSDSVKSTSMKNSTTAKYSEESRGNGTTGEVTRNGGSSDDVRLRPAATAAENPRKINRNNNNKNGSEISEYLCAEVDVLRLFERMKFESLRAENEVLRNELQKQQRQQKLKGKVVAEREVGAQKDPQVSSQTAEQGMSTSSNSEVAVAAVKNSTTAVDHPNSSFTSKYSDDLLLDTVVDQRKDLAGSREMAVSSTQNNGAITNSKMKKGGDGAAAAVEVTYLDGTHKQKNKKKKKKKAEGRIEDMVVDSEKEVRAVAASKNREDMVVVGEDMDVVLLSRRRRMRRRFGGDSSSQRNLDEEFEEGGGGFLNDEEEEEDAYDDDDDDGDEDVVDDEDERLMGSSAAAASSGSVRLLRDLIFCRAPFKGQRRSVSAARSRRPI